MFYNKIPKLDDKAKFDLLARSRKIRTSALFGSPELLLDDCMNEALLLYFDHLMDRVEGEHDLQEYKKNLIKEHQEKI